MTTEIKENGVYTSDETQALLKISQSTFKRLVKKGVIRAAKIGGQYRILGKHLLELFSSEMQQEARKVYSKARDKVKSWENFQ